MPLFMDFHKIPNITIKEAQTAHIADEKIQKKYGVKYLQFWVNQEAGNLFCLVEGPDQATCETVHRLAHGHLACAMVEVDPGYYSLIMGEKFLLDNGLVRDPGGSVDLGYRTILALTLETIEMKNAKGVSYKDILQETKEQLHSVINSSGGRSIKLTGTDTVLGVFNQATDALRCALQIDARVSRGKELRPALGIGVGTGQPVTINNEFINETIRLAENLSSVAGRGRILLSSLTAELCEDETRSRKTISLTANQETFLGQLFDVVNKHLGNEDFSVESLVTAMGISRPQLYRKVRDIAGKAPNELVRDIRLRKAYSLLRQRAGNIAEIAFKVGFSNPSYFAKCFARHFGIQPKGMLPE